MQDRLIAHSPASDLAQVYELRQDDAGSCLDGGSSVVFRYRTTGDGRKTADDVAEANSADHSEYHSGTFSLYRLDGPTERRVYLGTFRGGLCTYEPKDVTLVCGGVEADGLFIPWETINAANRRVMIHEDYGASYTVAIAGTYSKVSLPAATILALTDRATKGEAVV